MNYLSLVIGVIIFLIRSSVVSGNEAQGVSNEPLSDSIRFQTIQGLIYSGKYDVKPDSLYILVNEAGKLAKSTDNSLFRIKALMNLGLYYQLQGNYYESLLNYQKALELSEADNDQITSAKLHRNLAIAYYNLGNYSKAIEHSTICLQTYEILNDSVGIARSLNTRGVVYHEIENLAEAMRNYSRSAEICKKNKYDKNLAFVYNNIGIVYSELLNYDSSLYYFNKTLALKEQSETYESTSNVITNIANVYFNQGKLDLALRNFEKSYEIDQMMKNSSAMSISLINIGNVYFKKNLMDRALEKYKQALEISREQNYFLGYRESSYAIYNVLKTKGHYNEALLMYEKYVKIKDSLLNTAIKEEAIHQEYKYRYEKKLSADSIRFQKEIEITNAQILVQEAQLSEERNKLNSLYIISVILVLSAFIFIRLQIQKRKKDKQLFLLEQERNREEIENANKELKFNQQQLNKSLKNIVEKNQIIQNLEEELKSKNKGEDNIEIESLAELLERRVVTNEDWVDFKTHFLQIYPHFINYINNELKHLTESELRLFMLLGLKHSSYELTKILGVSESGVKKSRYRLRKKLGLKQEENLQAFIDGFIGKRKQITGKHNYR